MHGELSWVLGKFILVFLVGMLSRPTLPSGILVPGGFGKRGTEGMILAIKWAREQKIPFLGICLGFQLAVIEWTRNVLQIPGMKLTRLIDAADNF